MPDDGSSSHSASGQRRARAQLSCTPCRHGKLKCNRGHPACDQCVKRGKEDTCTYVSPPQKAKQTQNMRGRIRHLEKLVVDLMNQNEDKSPLRGRSTFELDAPEAGVVPKSGSNGLTGDGPAEPNADYDADMAKLKISNGEPSYVGGTHWASLLEAITEVKDSLEKEDSSSRPSPPEDTESPPPLFTQGPSALFGSVNRTSRESLLKAIPPKHVVDRLIFQWFNSRDPFLHILHAPTFQIEYKKFWADHSTASIQWLGLLFSIMGIMTLMNARHANHGRPVTPGRYSDIVELRDHAASALALADFTRPKTYTIESLMMFAQFEYLGDTDSQMKMWLMIGLVGRLGLRMGYHRDPSRYGNITPYEGEMRRRVWRLLYQLDILISFTLGLPSTIRTVPSDTGPPHNLLDSDFSVDSTHLPPCRPFEELTPASYSIAKYRICSIFGAATDMSHALTPPPYEDILEHDQRLLEAYRFIPPALRVRPLADSVTDPPELIMTRFNLELLYQKTRCVLHRKYLIQGQTDPQYAYSRDTCIDAALTLLRHHITIFSASQPGGQLNYVRWYMSSLTNHDFLLAGMIVCLELNHRCRSGLIGSDAGAAATDGPSSRDMIDALESSYTLWQDLDCNRPSDSHLAKRALDAMLKRVKGYRMTPAKDDAATPLINGSMNGNMNENVNGNDNLHLSIDPSLDTVPDMLLPGNNNEPLLGTVWNDEAMPDFEPIGDMIETPFNLNWENWDHTITSSRDPFQSALWTHYMTGDSTLPQDNIFE